MDLGPPSQGSVVGGGSVADQEHMGQPESCGRLEGGPLEESCLQKGGSVPKPPSPEREEDAEADALVGVC